LTVFGEKYRRLAQFALSGNDASLVQMRAGPTGQSTSSGHLRAAGFAGAKQRKVASNERLVGAQEQAWQRQKNQELAMVSASPAWVTANGEWWSVSR
jgi:TPP-dependent trihydroxycyclohexane-1,2-dione (THcHDO) dehydratase